MPVDFKNWEAYLFGTVDATRQIISGTGPALEFNVGALPNLQVHLVVPLAFNIPRGEAGTFGKGDMEFGLKYRFIQESNYLPMVAVFPLLEIPTGDVTKGLSNVRAWGKLPVWLQKSWGPWTGYGGGGYAINPAPDQRNYWFGGWLLQRDIGERLTLGGEIFAQRKSSEDSRSYAVFNLGGYFKITPNFQVLFSGGHSLAGANHTIGYLGLYWTAEIGQSANQGVIKKSHMDETHSTETPRKTNLKELSQFFLRLGTIAFGGPAAHVAMMEDEVVRRRQWLPREKFLDLLGTANLIPGPSSTEMAIFIGFLCQGWAGLFIGGLCFILPAMLIVIGFAWAYVRFGSLPQISWLLYGIKPVVIAIILQALWQLGRTALKNRFLGALAIIAMTLNLLGMNILVILFGTGMFSGTWQGLRQDRSKNWQPVFTMLLAAGCFCGRLLRYRPLFHRQGILRSVTTFPSSL